MKEYLSIFKLDENANLNYQLRFLLINCFVFFLPFERFYSTLMLFVIVFISLFDIKNLFYKQLTYKTIIFQSIWILTVIGYLFSDDKQAASNLIEKQSALFIFPILLPLIIPFTKYTVKIISTSLVLGVITALIVLFGYLIADYILIDDFQITDHFNHNFSSPISIHATYLSLMVNLSIVVLLYFIEKSNHKLNYILPLIFLLAGIVFLASRNVTISTFLILLIYLFMIIKNKLIYFLIVSLSTLTIYFIINTNSYLQDRFSSKLLNDVSIAKYEDKIHTLEPRSERWKLGWQVFKNSPIYGNGSGDEVSELKKKYVENKMFISYIENFNIHNQYLSILIKHGVIGFILFIGSLIYYVYLGLKSKNKVYLIFLAVIFISSMTENIFDMNKGIFYFAFFNTLFGYYSLNMLKEKREL